MKIILYGFIVLPLVVTQRFGLNNYLQNFGTDNNPDRTEITKLGQTGEDISFVTTLINIKINRRYSDADLLDGTTYFDLLFQDEIATASTCCTPNQNCRAKSDDTILKQCTDLTQKRFGNPDFHLNDLSLLQQVVTKVGLYYYLTETEGWNNIDYKQKAEISCISSFGTFSVQIRVTSILKQLSRRRILVSTTYDPITEEAQEIECNKAEGSDLCSTYEQEEAEKEFQEEDFQNSYDKYLIA